MAYKPLLAITAGDPAGIGPEICLKALAHRSIYAVCRPLIIGHPESLRQVQKIVPELDLNFIRDIRQARFRENQADCLLVEPELNQIWHLGQNSPDAGIVAYKSVEKGIELALDGQVDAVVTAPINKKSLNMAGFAFAGHTEIFRQLTGSNSAAMLLVSGSLRVIHVTTHMSMLQACAAITRERVLQTIRLADTAQNLLGLNGQIAVAGLNAHCSEGGLFGSEEEKSIEPAIAQARAEGIEVIGPIPADTVFVKAAAGQYDMVVAMYHDQGHIPVKMHGFKIDPASGEFTSVSGVNCTIGLPIIRTSVDHGTAFDLAGKGLANEQSLLDAIEMAADMAISKRQNND